MNKTSIEWVKNPDGTQGYTHSDITGCLNHTPEGLCLGGMFPCYAFKLANGRLRGKYLANSCLPTHDESEHEAHHLDPFYPRFWRSRYLDARDELCNAKPRGIFLDDMGDWMGIGVPESWTRQELELMRDRPQHRFYTLTKQPQNLPKFSPFPDNCWVGVTVTGEPPKLTKLFNALDAFDDIQCKIRYLSFEPLLDDFHIADLDIILGGSVDWLIIGAQTKPCKPPRIEWVEEIVRAADRAGVPVFLKDNLLELVNYKSPETEFAFNKEGYYRQEMPE